MSLDGGLLSDEEVKEWKKQLLEKYPDLFKEFKMEDVSGFTNKPDTVAKLNTLLNLDMAEAIPTNPNFGVPLKEYAGKSCSELLDLWEKLVSEPRVDGDEKVINDFFETGSYIADECIVNMLKEGYGERDDG